jgi:hypothetical protein
MIEWIVTACHGVARRGVPPRTGKRLIVGIQPGDGGSRQVN